VTVAGAGSEQLLCPSCGRTYGSAERFCPDCGVPLTHSGGADEDPPVSDLHRRARKIKPQLSEGRLVRVAGARDQVEGEFIQDLLLQAGVPSVLRRSAGFDVPDFLAAGPRDVLVPQSGVMTAREVLLQAELVPTGVARPTVSPVRLLLSLLAALGIGVLIVWAISQALA
jgi:hypothetical protein